MTRETESKYYCLRQTQGVDDYLNGFTPLPAECVPVDEALGRVLHADAVATRAWPPAARSTRDGYALRRADVALAGPGAPARLRCAGECRMGEASPAALGPGEAFRVYTGSELPAGADTVVMQEHADERHGFLTVETPPAEGSNTLQAGADFPPGALLARGGLRLRPQDLALLAQCFSRVEVRRRAVLGILATGDELCRHAAGAAAPAGAPRPIPSGAYASGALYLDALARSLGARTSYFGISPDDPDAMRERVRAALAGPQPCDVLVMTGGSSGGRRDITPQVLASLPGCELTGADQRVSSGRPMVFGRIGGTSVWVLPGHLLSLFMSAQLFLAPLLRRLMGMEAQGEASFAQTRALLARHLPSKGVAPAHYPVTLERGESGPRAHPVPLGTGRNAVLRDMAGWVTVPGGGQGLPQDHLAAVHLFV